VTGESTKETVKTIAQGMPGVSGVTVVTNSCAFYFAHEAAGASCARHSLCPLISEGRTCEAKLGRLRREIARLRLTWLHEIYIDSTAPVVIIRESG